MTSKTTRTFLFPLLAFIALTMPLRAQPPIASDDILVAIENQTLDIEPSTLLANDEYFPYEPIVSVDGQPASGVVTPGSGGGLRFEPDPDVFGRDAFTYTLSTTAGTSSPASVSLWTAPFRGAFAGNWDGDPDDVSELAWIDSRNGRVILCDGNAGTIECVVYATTLETIGRDPLAMDWDGDGVDEITLFDPTTGTFALTDFSMAGGERTLTPAGTVVIPEAAGQRPVAGRWLQGGVDVIGFYEPATGWFRLRDANTPGPFVHAFQLAPSIEGLPIAGDWDDDGVDTVGLYHRATGEFRLATGHHGQHDHYTGASPGMIPFAGRWNAGAADSVAVHARGKNHVTLFDTLPDDTVIKPRPVQILEDPP